MLNGRNKGKRRSRRPKQNKDIAKAGCHHIRMTPCLFAFIWFSSVSVALLAWWRACASLHWENRCSHNGRRKQIIRTRLLYPIGSKFGLSLFAYVCRKRCRRKALRKTRPEPSTAYLVWTRVRSWGRGRILSENERSGGVPAADNLACRYSETANTTTPYIKPYDTTVALCGEPSAACCQAPLSEASAGLVAHMLSASSQAWTVSKISLSGSSLWQNLAQYSSPAW